MGYLRVVLNCSFRFRFRLSFCANVAGNLPSVSPISEMAPWASSVDFNIVVSFKVPYRDVFPSYVTAVSSLW